MRNTKTLPTPGALTAAGTSYEGVTHAGIAVVAADTGRVLLARRTMDETDDPAVQETWEFPGGGLDVPEEPLAGAIREYVEETGLAMPAGEVTNGWRAGGNSEDGHYQGFVYTVPAEYPLDGWVPTEEVQDLAWFDSEGVQELENSGLMRPEIVATMDWNLIFPVSGNKEQKMAVDPDEKYEDPAEEATETPEEEAAEEMAEPDYTDELFALDGPIPVHGVVAPEELSSGDSRAFNAGAMTKRPLRLPFSDQRVAIGGHDGSVVVGSVDRLMRKDGMIHWEGALMPTQEADDLAERMEFFGGRFGVSVDGDQGGIDAARTEDTGTLWFEQVRAAGLTAVAIPAFHEAYVAFGPHPEMPQEDEALTAAAYDSGDLIGGQSFNRGAGWVTDPKATKRIHDYWTKKGQPGYAKIGWGTRGDFTRAKRLIGEKIAANSPAKMKYLNQIIAQWHHDALGYWPGDLNMPGNATTAEARAKRAGGLDASLSGAETEVDYAEVTRLMTEHEVEGIEPVDTVEGDPDTESVWEAVLVSSVSGNKTVRPPLSYFHRHESGEATVIEDPDENGFRRTYGYAAEWGVCHIGFDGRCVEPPIAGSDDYPEFHLGRTKVLGPDGEGFITTGLLTYEVGHRDAKKILSESPSQAHFDNIKNAWAAVRVGEDERGIWFSGVVLPKVDEEDITLIQASGQVSGEWKHGALRACLTVNVPGFPVVRASAEYDDEGNVLALAASAFGAARDVNGTAGSECDREPTPLERIQALASADAEARLANIKKNWTV